MALIDIEIEDYLDEVDTKYLVQELLKRKNRKKYKSNPLDDLDIPNFNNPEQLLTYIKRLLKLRQWHDKKRIIAEIEQL